MLLVALTGCTDDESAEPVGNPRAYDVQSYDVDASVTIEGDDQLDAVTTIVAVAEEPLENFELDLVGLEVERVLVDGEPAEFTRPSGLLSITPASPIGRGTEFTAEVHYSGDPSQEGDADEALEAGGGWLDLGDSYSVVVAEPVGARTWLPSNDVPSDKATVTVEVEVPGLLSAVSNGVLAQRPAIDAESGRWRWVATEPMAPYLITLAVGEFGVSSRTAPGGPEIIDAFPPTHRELAERFDRTGEMLAFLAERFGPYPFSTGGAIVVPGMPQTALETQTRPVYSVAALEHEDEGGQLVLHELAHQWFGDAVTPESWDDVWLNEGPAVYSQWLWLESNDGPSVLESARASWDPDDPALDVPPADPGDDLFGASVYERSAIFLVELRELMGLDAFHELLRTWVEEHRFANATTDEFVELAGELHGSSIESLSDPWLYGDELPPLTF